MAEGLHIHLLGEPELTRGGVRLPLPPSKKTRALLGYLALTGRAQRRERLCELLWDVADDPRAALRWSLTKLRELVDVGAPRLIADREHVRLELGDVYVDVLEARRLEGEPLAELPTARLEQALALFRGELLEGLELPDFHAYHTFCLAERESLRRLHERILIELLARHAATPERALGLARRWVDLDPASERARAHFLQLLHAAGRAREAALIARADGRLLATASAAPASALPTVGAQAHAHDGEPANSAPGVRAGHTIARELGAEESASALRETSVGARLSELPEPFVGRAAELGRVAQALGAPEPGRERSAAPRARALLVLGAPGIGKSRLLQRWVARERSLGSLVYEGAAHEIDPGFPYAAWRAVFAALGLTPSSDDAEVPAAKPPEAAAEARAALCRTLSAAFAQRLAPGQRLLLAFENVHWLDEASALLLLQLLRTARAGVVQGALAVLLTSRSGELADNAVARRLVRALRAEQALEELTLAPLSCAETCELVAQVADGVDGAAVHAESAGNPLFALELARARAHGVACAAGVPASITQLVRERMEALSPELVELLRWASVLGVSFQLDALAPLLALEAPQFVAALEQLERLGWLRFGAEVSGESPHFAHDLVHRAIYDGLSSPRRRLMHAHVARRLAALPTAHGPDAAELARHAVLGGDADAAVRACLSAGRSCLQLFAVQDAVALSRRGLGYVGQLKLPARCLLEIQLHELGVFARRADPDSGLDQRLHELALEALALGEAAHARRAFFLQAWLRWEAGEIQDAERFSLEAERCSRLAGPGERVRALADSAQCLVLLERDLASAQAFVLEAEALIADGETEIACLPYARGLLELHRGELASARDSFERGHTLAQQQGERLLGFYALEWRLEVELAQQRWADAEAVTKLMMAQAERSRDGSEAPFARAAAALVAYALGREPRSALEQALAELTRADAKQRSAYLLARWAELELERGELGLARAQARAGLALAQIVHRTSEIALCRAVLTEAARRAGDEAEADAERAALRALDVSGSTARARAARERALGSSPRSVRQRREEHGARDRRARVR